MELMVTGGPCRATMPSTVLLEVLVLVAAMSMAMGVLLLQATLG